MTDDTQNKAIEALAEALHELDGTQHYVTHEQGYDGDDIEGTTCATGVEGHNEDAADFLFYLDAHPEAKAALAAWLDASLAAQAEGVVADLLAAESSLSQAHDRLRAATDLLGAILRRAATQPVVADTTEEEK